MNHPELRCEEEGEEEEEEEEKDLYCLNFCSAGIALPVFDQSFVGHVVHLYIEQ